MDNNQKVQTVIWGAVGSVVGNAAYDGIKKIITVGIPVVILAVSSPQKNVETSKTETPLKAVYASQDQTFIGSPSPRMMMPPTNTFFTTTSGTLAVVSGDQTMVRGI
ncbi:hypothetical protein [Aquabacterium sp.]|uniref:hypothetical protein n=1 Tax=Aquabacterium sp. TaxID=1872578 RepID=UPI003BB0B379